MHPNLFALFPDDLADRGLKHIALHVHRQPPVRGSVPCCCRTTPSRLQEDVHLRSIAQGVLLLEQFIPAYAGTLAASDREVPGHELPWQLS